MENRRFKKCSVNDIASEQRNSIVGGPFGSDLVSKDYVEFGVPVIRGTNLGYGRWVGGDFAYVTDDKADSLASNCAYPGDIVFTQRGTLGQVAIVPNGLYQRYLLSQSQMKLAVDPLKADAKFIYYVFTGEDQKEYIRQNAIQTGVPHTNLSILRRTPLLLPSLKDQQAIASILGTLDDKIELNRQRNRTLEAMARALFQSWFVDFDPVKAKAAGKNPPGLKPEIAALFPDSFDASTPLLPKGWTMHSLNTLCEIGRGSSPRPIHNFMGGDVPWIKIADATAAEGPFIYSTKEYVTKEGSEKSFWVSPGDLILSNSATCGVPIYVGIRGCIHDGWLHFSNLKIISKGFLYHWLHSISEHLIHIADGSVQKNLNTKLVGEQQIVIAPCSILNHFEQLNSVVFCQIDCHIREMKTLKALRDTLLPRLISGELRVRDAERIIARNV